MTMRKSEKKRTTAETSVRVSVNLDGVGESKIETGVGFFDHMLTLFAKHGGFDLVVKCKGDLAVDGHHSIEDIGIVLGEAVKEALGDKAGIARYGSFYIPMDESLAFVAVDISASSVRAVAFKAKHDVDSGIDVGYVGFTIAVDIRNKIHFDYIPEIAPVVGRRINISTSLGHIQRVAG